MNNRLKEVLFILGFFCVPSIWAEPIRNLYPTKDSGQHGFEHNSPNKPLVNPLGDFGKNRTTETLRSAVSVCLVSDGEFKQGLDRGDIAGVLGNVCKMNGVEKGSSLKLNGDLKDLLSEPVLISEGKVCQKNSIKDAFGFNATTEYKKILEKKLVQHCVKVICKEKDLGDSCNIAPGAVTVSPNLVDEVVKMYGAQLSCKKSDILQISR